MRKIFRIRYYLLISCAFLITNVSCVTSNQNHIPVNKVPNFQPELNMIMALQLFSSQYGLPPEFSVKCCISNNIMTVKIADEERYLGRATISYRDSSINTELRLFECVKTGNAVPPELVSMAMLWGYEKRCEWLLNGFSVNVKKENNEYCVYVSSDSLTIGDNYFVNFGKNMVIGRMGY
jgi:hypothetical protein